MLFNLTMIEIETDSLTLYCSLRFGRPILQISSMWHDIVDLALTLEYRNWTFVKRSGNRVAYNIPTWALCDIPTTVANELVHHKSSDCANANMYLL